MTRVRIKNEGLIAAFPKLINSNSQSTLIETGDVRYVYQPLEELYILLITTKQSNIMEDLETLRLFAKLVPEYCGGNTEAIVTANIFDLIYAVDEVLSLGYKENVSLQQIRTYVEMDSHEEKLQRIIMESKITEAKEAAKEKLKLLLNKKKMKE